MSLPFTQIVPIQQPEQFKLHLACWNGISHPLDDFARGMDHWMGWNRYRGARNRFNRPYILSFMQNYTETGSWFFGGVFKMLSDSNPEQYDIELAKESAHLIGRLKVTLPRPGPRGDSFKLEGALETIEVVELLKEPWSGQAFYGYENINHDFPTLETIFHNNRPDWRSALSNVKGIYLIRDKSNGKKYVGSAYGDIGIWSRWQCYMHTGHGHNDELCRLIDEKGLAYARENFHFCLLEYRAMKTDDHIIIERENYWKEALGTRGLYGYNKN